MSDEIRIAFIRQIAEEPEAVEPRLVFADWCQEQADSLFGEAGTIARARAEYIRVQCEQTWRDQLYPPYTPLKQRELDLEAAYLRHWLAELPEWATSPDGFYRGFAYEIRSTPADLLAHGDALAELTPLCRIRLSENPPGSLLALADREWWRYVRSLHVERWFEPGEATEFANRADIRNLALFNNMNPAVLRAVRRQRFGGS